MIIDIRGTNGSGKSHPIHEILRTHPNVLWELQTPPGIDEKVDFTVVDELNLAIIGSYKTQCGGADGVTKQDAITYALRHLYPMYKTVIVEGSIVASVYSRWEALARELNDDYWFWFLDTPVQQCIDSVLARRKATGNLKPFDPDKTLIPRHEAIERLKGRLVQAGRRVANLSRDTIGGALIRQVQLNAGIITG